MSITAMRTAIVDKLEDRLTSLKVVAAHPGRFTLAELQRWAVRSPCGLVVALGARRSEMQGHETMLIIDWGFYIVCRGTSDTTRDVESLDHAYRALQVIQNNRWDYDGAWAPRIREWTNPYITELDRSGIAMQVVAWEQGLNIGTVVTESTADDLETIYTSYRPLGAEEEANVLNDVLELEQ